MPTVDATTVCICTRRRADDLARTLASIAESDPPVDQVVVSDDGHDAATQRVSDDAAVPVDYVLGPGEGLGANRNCALRHATGRYILFLDDDCLLSRTYLAQALACMRDAERTHGADRVIVSGTELRNGQVVVAHEQTFLGFQSRPYAPGEPLRTIVINATLFPARLFTTITFDAELRYGLEELDIATRAVAAGFHIVGAPTAQNDHRPSPLGREDYHDAADASRLYITVRRYAVIDKRFARAAAFVLIAPLHLILSRVKRQGLRRGSSSAIRILLDTARKLKRSPRVVGAI